MALINNIWNQGGMAGPDILPPITAQFFVPRMVNKPQDPIVHAIEKEKVTTLVKRDARDPTYLKNVACAQNTLGAPSLSLELLWAKSATSGHQHSVRTLCCVMKTH
jgi:hypothetical protein